MVTPQLKAALVVPEASTSHHSAGARSNCAQLAGRQAVMKITASR